MTKSAIEKCEHMEIRAALYFYQQHYYSIQVYSLFHVGIFKRICVT